MPLALDDHVRASAAAGWARWCRPRPDMPFLDAPDPAVRVIGVKPRPAAGATFQAAQCSEPG
jgi:hypothetical protein